MIGLSLLEVAAAVGGRLVDASDAGTTVVTGATVDSRRAAPGDLYVAIVGERVDGHDFALPALGAGAVATLGTRPTSGPTIIVDDPVAALGRLAAAALARLPKVEVIAVTGSSGKTTTKDLIADLLAEVGPTVATAGSLNNEVGLPLTVLQATAETRYLVLEMGARGPGHITTLCKIAAPRVGVVLNVGSAHVGEFGSREVTASSKAELVASLDPDGLAVLNLDDPLVAGMAEQSRAPIVGYGTSSSSAVRITNLRLDDQARPGFGLDIGGQRHAVQMSMVGEHMASNAAAAAAVAHQAGLAGDRIVALIEAAKPRSRWRMEVGTTSGGVTVLNDAYNANPESMRVALRSLAAMAGGGRTFAVLGEMLELGDASIAEHDAIGRLAVRLHISRTIAVGSGARALYLGASQEGSWGGEAQWVPDVEAATDLLRHELAPGDVVLVKASRSIGLERVADALLTAPVEGTS